MQTQPFVERLTLLLSTVMRAGVGAFELRVSESDSGQYYFVIQLDKYQSHCHADWLSYRWRFDSLAFCGLSPVSDDHLQVYAARRFTNPALAKDAFEAWVESVTNDLESAKKERI